MTPFDPADAALIRDPYPTYAALREHEPLHWAKDGYWVATRFNDVRQVLIGKPFGQGDFVSNINLFYGDDFDVLANSAYAWLSRVFVMQDPPDHTRLRGLVAGALSLKRIRAMEPQVQRLADQLLDRFRAKGEADFITEFAYRFPTLVMCDMLGLKDDEYSDDLLLALNQAIADSFVVFETRALDPLTLERANQQTDFLTAFFDELFERRRRQPQDDLTTALVHAEFEGDTLSPEELSTSVIGLFGAGFETTAHMIGNGMGCLARFPEQRQRLIADPSLAEATTEEVLRYESPLQATYRTALSDQIIAGHTVEAGQRILGIVAAANRDHDAFDDPEAFDISPRATKPLTFGGGIHYCVGAELARMEGRVFFETLARRFPDFQVDLDNSIIRPAFLFRGYQQLPVSLA